MNDNDMTYRYHKYRYVNDDTGNDKLVYDMSFSKQEIHMILEALDQHYNKESTLSKELEDIINRLKWCSHSPGRRADR